MDILLSPIGWVRSSVKDPREDYWGEVVSEIVLDRDSFSPEALDGLSEFSHVEVLFHLHGVDESSVITGRRHPRGNVQWPEVGIFAQRAKRRPNRIAATIFTAKGLRERSARPRPVETLFTLFSRTRKPIPHNL